MAALPLRNLLADLKLIPFLKGLALLFFLLTLFYPVITGLVLDWWTHPDYTHGFLIPFISGYLIWHMRKELVECPKSSSLTGFVLFLLGLALYIVGTTGGEEFIQRISLPVVLIGLVYYLGGKKIAWLSLFPIGYLILMIPLPYTLFKAISLKLRLFDARIITSWSSFFGVPVFQDGYFLRLPHVNLEVADVCSGVFSIVALLAIGTFYIYINRMQMWRKVLLWLFLIPVAILGNVVRIFIIVVLTHYSGDWILNTTFHKFNGTFNFLLGFLAILLIGLMINKIPIGKEGRL